jgi:hypothetical protein
MIARGERRMRRTADLDHAHIGPNGHRGANVQQVVGMEDRAGKIYEYKIKLEWPSLDRVNVAQMDLDVPEAIGKFDFANWQFVR